MWLKLFIVFPRIFCFDASDDKVFVRKKKQIGNEVYEFKFLSMRLEMLRNVLTFRTLYLLGSFRKDMQAEIFNICSKIYRSILAIKMKS